MGTISRSSCNLGLETIKQLRHILTLVDQTVCWTLFMVLVQWNLSITDTHSKDPMKCPDYRGAPISEVV